MLQKYFDKVVMINLDKEKDRLALSTENCKRVGIEFERVKATPGRSKFVKMNGKPHDGWNRNAAALAYTTAKIIKRAKKEGWKNVFIMEDDVDFININFNSILKVAKHGLDKQANGWDFFHLNSTHQYTSKWVSSCLHRLGGAWCCQAYAVNNTVYDRYLAELERYTIPIDNITLNLHQERKNSFCTVPDIVIHHPGNFSSLRDKVVEY